MKYLNFIIITLILVLTHYVRSEFIYSCKEKKTIALTFDDGPHRYSRRLVDYLKKYPDVKVTFFTVGRFHYPFAINVRDYQKAMRKAHKAGYQIASHTYEHKIPTDKYEFKKALKKMDDFIEEITGERPRYFRAPKGLCDKECQENVDDWGYKLIQWDVDTNDWDLEGAGSTKRRVKESIKILKRNFEKEKDNYLILMHDTEEYTVDEIVPWIVEESGMREKGYRFVTVAECLGNKSSMYKSGNTYGDNETKPHTIPVNETSSKTENTETLIPEYHDIEYTDPLIDSIVYSDNLHHLQSVAFAVKPMLYISYISFGLLALFMHTIY